MSGTLSVGLLGATVDEQRWDFLGAKALTEARLDEIERRILAIEAGMRDAGIRVWRPHFDYAGEPMEPGEFRDPPEDQWER